MNDEQNTPNYDEPTYDETAEDKPKRGDRQVEWQFDFANLGQSFRNLMGSLAGDAETQHDTFSAAIDQATSANVEIQFSVGKGSIRPMATSDMLIEAELTYVGDVHFSAEGDLRKRVKLEQKTPRNVVDPIRQGFRALADREDLNWDVALTPRIPLDLEINGGVGPIDVDLTGLQLASLEIDSGVGTMDVTLPSQSAPLDAEIDGGVGQFSLVVPEGLSGTIKIDAGVGQVNISLPRSLAVQFEASTGMGSVDLPDAMIRVEGKREFMDNSGVWQTEGYELADRKLVIHYDGGIGSLRVRFHDPV